MKCEDTEISYKSRRRSSRLFKWSLTADPLSLRRQRLIMTGSCSKSTGKSATVCQFCLHLQLNLTPFTDDKHEAVGWAAYIGHLYSSYWPSAEDAESAKQWDTFAKEHETFMASGPILKSKLQQRIRELETAQETAQHNYELLSDIPSLEKELRTVRQGKMPTLIVFEGLQLVCGIDNMR